MSRLRPDSCKGLIGPKGASLCTLRRLGARVPPCFFVTTTAFREQWDAGNLRSQLTSLLDGLDANPDRIQRVLEQIRQLVLNARLGEDLHRQIAVAYNRLGAGIVAVRSSATAEDLPGQSFAGQYETILGVRSQEECLDAIKRCWASLWTERAYDYRRRNGMDHRQVEMAVIVQRQIEPDAAGVAFSLDPLTGSSSRIVIEACHGLGEALVSGRVRPDRIVLRKKNLSLIRQTTADGQTRESVLSLRLARSLARQVRRIERKLGGPQDVEWAVRDGTLWFLQARPITAIPPAKSWEERQVWTNVNLGEIVPDVMTPMTRSIIMPWFEPLFDSVVRLCGADLRKGLIVGLVAGRPYFNGNTTMAIGRPFNIGPEEGAHIATVMGGEQYRQFEAGRFDLCDEDLPDLGFSWPRYVLSWPGILRTLIAHRPSRGEAYMRGIHERADMISQTDVANMPTKDLARFGRRILDESFADLDLLYLGAGFVGLGVLQKICRDWLGDEGLAYRLLAGQGGLADTEAGHDLWRLAALAHENEQTEALVQSDTAWAKLRPKLQRVTHGRQFVAAWDRFMLEHGHHCRGELELRNPRWSERPDYILHLVRGYLSTIDRANPLTNHERLALEAEQLAGECRQQLRNPIRRRTFNWALRNARKVGERENWKNEAVRHIAALRRILLEVGRRLQQRETLQERDDIFFLELSEIEPVVAGTAGFDVDRRIAERRTEYERNTQLTPPPVVVGRYDPERHRAPEIDGDAKVLKGTAVSPGVATGRARVILRSDDDQQVEAGEILVAPFTDPAWTPYFLPAAAVVMDMGGVLSHGAIIAREYGLPAVANVGAASKIIRTGQTIRVDGDQGTVTVLDNG